METGDTRYLHLNTGMWVGSGVRRGTESMLSSYSTQTVTFNNVLTLLVVVYDAYRII